MASQAHQPPRDQMKCLSQPWATRSLTPHFQMTGQQGYLRPLPYTFKKKTTEINLRLGLKGRESIIPSCSLMSQARWSPESIGVQGSSLRAHHSLARQPLSPWPPPHRAPSCQGSPPAPARLPAVSAKPLFKPANQAGAGPPPPGSFPSYLLTSPTGSPFSFMCRAGGLGGWGCVAGPRWTFCEASR